jgi:hypothetical protein
MQGVESTEAEILLELGDTAHEELPAKGRRAIVILWYAKVWFGNPKQMLRHFFLNMDQLCLQQLFLNSPGT